MQRVSLAMAMVAVGLTGMVTPPAWSANVQITPLGSHEGEFCRSDRALIFEDPDGTRILYDAGRTVRGPDDERLGEVDAVLLSHVHGDHLGDAIQSGSGASRAQKPRHSSTP
jgi:glyoxylase-like metal-dependent hydrolase (beta-lactamase superfamily II)